MRAKLPVTLVDTNPERVAQARALGLNCLQGNALNEEVMEEAKPENVATLIGLTTNSQVNLLAAQLAHDRNNFV